MGNRSMPNTAVYSVDRVSYLSRNRMTSTSALNPLLASYYDPTTGNITYDGLHNYIYDEKGRLFPVCNVSPSRDKPIVGTQYLYDAEGRRVAERDNYACDMRPDNE